MLVPETEIIVSKDGVQILRKTVRPGDYVLGREPQCDVQVDVELVSRRHAQLTVNYDHVLIEDLGSSNGTFVNGLLVIEATRLWPNQKVRIGAATVEIRRIKTVPPPDVSLAPQTVAVQRLLPEELLREKKYNIGKVVAKGGMGAILDARDAATQRGVAMKVMLDSSSPDDLRRFIAEARVTAQLEHPNVVPVHELSVDENGQPFYTMKMVRGITLRKVLELLAAGVVETGKKYPLPARLTIFQKVCDALAFAHSKGVIHRDLKPENIMLDDFGVVLVMDWGLAKRIGNAEAGMRQEGAALPVERFVTPAPHSEFQTLTGTIMGTPQYMSPEQARGEVENLDIRSDIYALGAILYQILALRAPVTGHTAMEIVDKVGRGEMEPLIAPKNGTTPDSLAAVVRKAMAFDRDQRYWAVEELQRDLTAYQNGFATSAENAGLRKQFLLALKRHKAVTTSIAAALLILASVLSVAFIRVTGEKNRATRALAELRKTAPTFQAQALALIKEGQLDEALGKIGTAIELDPTADYLTLKGCILQSLFRFRDAGAAFDAALGRDPGHALARENAALSRQLAPQVGVDGKLPKPGQETLLAALEKQGRKDEALLLANALGRTANLLRDEFVQRLQRALKWDDSHKAELGKRIGADDRGGLKVDLSKLPIADLSLLQGLPIVTLDISETEVTSLQALAGMPLKWLDAWRTNIDTLAPLRGMALTHLQLANTLIRDLTPLQGMPLEDLRIQYTNVTDLSPLRGMALTRLIVRGNITDLTPLKGMPLLELGAGNSRVADLSPLRGMPLQILNLINCPGVTDLTPLRGLPLVDLSLAATGVSDLAPLEGMPLRSLEMGGCVRLNDLRVVERLPQLERVDLPAQVTDLDFLRRHPKIQLIRWLPRPLDEHVAPRTSAPRFWKYYDEFKAAEKKFAAAFAEQGATFAPGRHLSSTGGGFFQADLIGTPLRDLRFLEGLPVAVLNIANTGISDLTPLAKCPLAELNAAGSQIETLAPLTGTRLTYLNITNTKVTDLSPLRGMPLNEVCLVGSGAKDVRILRTCGSLVSVTLPAGAEGVETLRTLPKILLIGFGNTQGVAAFWKEYDAQQKAGKK